MVSSENNSPLSEKDFIHEEYGRNPFPFWAWLFAVIGFSLLFSAALSKYNQVLTDQFEESPFLQVTNRELSLFLWQNPSYMRAHVKSKNGYLPAFQYVEKIGLNPEYADEYVQAPPDLLFLYHNWKRLLGNEIPIGKIPTDEFKVFLSDVEEWQPHYWEKAPKAYIELTDNLNKYGAQDLNQLPDNIFPTMIRQAFMGWKNYFYEGDEINQLTISGDQLKKFISKYPHYARNYWQNVYGDSYLKTFSQDPSVKTIPSEDIAPFLKAAIYNYLKT